MSNVFDLETLVAGTIKTAQEKVEEEKAKKDEDKKSPPPFASKAKDEKDEKSDSEKDSKDAEKYASALTEAAQYLRAGAVTTEKVAETDLEKIAEAYNIVARVEANPALAFKVKTALAKMGTAIPMVTGEGPGIGVGHAAGAMKNDLSSPPGGGASQQHATATAPDSVKPPMKPSTDNGVGVNDGGEALKTDVDSPPGGGEAYPEKGPIRKTATARLLSMARALPFQKAAATAESDEDGTSGASPKGKQAPIGKPEGASEVGEKVPAWSEPTIESNQAAIAMTKRDANHHPTVTGDLGKVLSTPAHSSANDDVIKKNLSDPGKVSKLAAAARRELEARGLTKTAAPTESPATNSETGRDAGSVTERESAFSEALQMAAQSRGERMGTSGGAPTEMPGSGNDNRPTMPGY